MGYRSRRAFGRRRGRRTVAWLPGLTTYDTAANVRARLVVLTQVNTAVPNTFGAVIALTTDSDLSQHGGEDAVLTRIRGRLMFTDGGIDVGAGFAANAFQLRVAVMQADVVENGSTMPVDITSSWGLGRDDILWSQDVTVSSVATTGVGTALDSIFFSGSHAFLDIDVRARRKVQSDRHVMLWFQTVAPAGATGIQFYLRGTARLLMMRSR